MAKLIRVCQKHGSLVAEIRERKANDAILKIRFEKNTNFVIGSGNDEAKDGIWVWASDNKVFAELLEEGGHPGTMFENFGPGWPIPAPKDNCLTMVASGPNAGKWQSKPCYTGMKVLCEAKVLSGKPFYPAQLDEIGFERN